MKTGYFARLKRYKEQGLTPISICGSVPDWYEGLQYKKLAPKWSFFYEWKNGSHKADNDYYIEHFNDEVLNKLDRKVIIDELEKLAGCRQENIILICYEKPRDFCHRHLVADWFSEAGIECVEFE